MRLTPNRWLAILCALIAIPTAIVVVARLRAPADPSSTPLRPYADRRADRPKPPAPTSFAVAPQRLDMLLHLFGDQPGAPGSLFAGLDLRRGWSTDPALRTRIDDFRAVTGGQVTIGLDEIVVYVPPPPNPHSDDVRRTAVMAWDKGDDDRWLDGHDLVRASLTVDARGATIRWERALSPDTLFPLDASMFGGLVPPLGAPADWQLPLDTYADRTSTGFTYALPPIGWSPDPVRIDVDTAHGTVAAVHIHTGALLEADRQQVKAALHAKYGAKVPLDGPGSWRGAGGLAIRSTLLVDSRMTSDGPLMGYRLDVTRAR